MPEGFTETNREELAEWYQQLFGQQQVSEPEPHKWDPNIEGEAGVNNFVQTLLLGDATGKFVEDQKRMQQNRLEETLIREGRGYRGKNGVFYRTG